jgi:NADPH:quinone reductase-like Zn-dependent oxidoreductase
MMRATFHDQYGGPEVLSIREIERPVPKDDEILVKVMAATVNRTDCGFLTARPFIVRFFTGMFGPKIPATGCDFAGTVEAVGKEVERFEVGDRVFGINDYIGSHAQYICVKSSIAVEKIPEGISFDKAVASLEGGHYAYSDIKILDLKAGNKVLVNGATGAIGSAAVQILKDMGMQVTAVGTTKALELLRSLGAERVISYEEEDFTKTDDQFVFIFDAVGKSTFSKCKQLLTPKGTYISTELGPNVQNIPLALFTPLLGGRRVRFPLPLDQHGSITYIKQLLEKGAFDAVIDRAYPLDQIRDAFAYVLSGQKTGNVIIHPFEE